MNWSGPRNLVEKFEWIDAGLPDEIEWIRIKWGEKKCAGIQRALIV